MEKHLKLQADYLTWKKDKTLIKQFQESNQEILLTKDKDNNILHHKILVEAHIYIPPPGANDIISDSPFLAEAETLTMSQQKELETLPFVKIIWSSHPDYEVGEVYSVKDVLASVNYNIEHREWWQRRATQPTLQEKEPCPPRFTMGWNAWNQFKYKINKFKKHESLKEEMVFLVPESVLITKSNI